MMPVLIQGPKQPDNNIDVYLRPLGEELLQLFKTINKCPALSNLSGHTNKGYNVCTHCLGETKIIYLDNIRIMCI
jgi:hypothetical protein